MMPRYFFDVHDGLDVTDEEGMELPDSSTARHHARGLVAEYASDPVNLELKGQIVVVTRDSASSVVSIVRMVCQEEVAEAAAA